MFIRKICQDDYLCTASSGDKMSSAPKIYVEIEVCIKSTHLDEAGFLWASTKQSMAVRSGLEVEILHALAGGEPLRGFGVSSPPLFSGSPRW